MRLVPLRGRRRRLLEAWFIRLAAWILIGRNVARAGVVSRRDNNDMWYMAEKLEGMAERIKDQYKTPDGSQ